MLDVSVIQLLYHLLQFLLHHMRCIKTLEQLYLLLMMVQLHMVHIFRLFLGLDMINLVLNDSYVVLNHNLFYQLFPIILPIQMGMQILYLLLLYCRILILLVNDLLIWCFLFSFLNWLRSFHNNLSNIYAILGLFLACRRIQVPFVQILLF